MPLNIENNNQSHENEVTRSLSHGSLFSGIGGFDLASQWMGWENIFHCEWNAFGKTILKYYWPNAKSYDDITKTDFTIHRGRIDVLTGGFPCQPYSVAGKRKGKEDERHLWPEMLRAIREIQPRYIVGENVRGLINWNGGMVFDEVQSDLENEGYEVLPFLLPAAGVNAPHRRDRIWFIAYSNNKGRSSGFGEILKKNGEISERNENAKPCNTSDAKSITNTESLGRNKRNGTKINNSERKTSEHIPEREKIRDWDKTISGTGFSSNTNSGRQSSKEHREKKSRQFAKDSFSGNWENFPTQSPICDGNDGIPSELDGITFSKWRNESIKGGGNAISPQVALQIFKSIKEIEILFTK